MSIKLYFAYSHLQNFPENLDDVGDEKGEWFYQHVKAVEERYQMRWDVNVMAIAGASSENLYVINLLL